ncbi:unnamed protein product [Mytilus coruscus]|uniref:Uncharacterized protein n=1 Tax=Mytilus coruscus TaxID=42192 RepID=A0A6J8D5A7_MYTCO|nr:unnamed protein product [Mytilus coruscus]
MEKQSLKMEIRSLRKHVDRLDLKNLALKKEVDRLGLILSPTSDDGTKLNDDKMEHTNELEALEASLLKQLTEKKDKYVTSLKRQDECIKDLVKCTKSQKESLEFVRNHVLDEIENKVKQLTESVADTSFTFVESAPKEKLGDLGSIEIKETPCSLPFVPYKQRQLQVPVVLKRQITSFTHIYDINMKGEILIGVTGIKVSDKNTLIFCDVITQKVYFYDEHDGYQSSISSPCSPWGIAAIPGTPTAVMSSQDETYIQFIDISKRRLLKKIKEDRRATERKTWWYSSNKGSHNSSTEREDTSP